ncbi:MAG TPA: hypothetical protein VHZ51_26205, partial [Ktedonobacteraceae bacterium]|nr:hypothetical protein [Ktedonobacteraceae bacterium]
LPGSAHIHSTADLSSNNVLVPLIMYLARHDGKFPDDKELRHCIHWLPARDYRALMQDLFLV